MLTTASAVQDFSICLRCQYRIAFLRRPRSQRQNRLLNTPLSRRMTSDHRLQQEQSQITTSTHAEEEVSSILPEPTKAKLRRIHWNRDELYSTDRLEVDAMGKPTDIIMLRDSEDEKIALCTNKAEDATENHRLNPSLSQIMKTINEERGAITATSVSENIENSKKLWLSQLQNRHGVPTKAEYLQMVNALYDGFTLQQLGGYYKAQTANSPGTAFELSRPYSTDLYTRSSWVPGCSAFPGKAVDRLLSLGIKLPADPKKTIKGNESTATGMEVSRRALGTKLSAAERIVREGWNMRVLEENEDMGELDVSITPTHLAILLSHRTGMFEKAAEAFGAKVEASRLDNVIRITSDKDTCADMFRFICYTLEKIRGLNISLPCKQPTSRTPWLDEPNFLNQSLIQQIEQLTSTVIRPINHSKWDRKGAQRLYRIFYLGPDEDDVENARRLLTHTSQPTTSKLPLIIWHDQEFAQGAPRPIEVGKRLPLVARGIQWSRWAAPITRTTLASPAEKAGGLGTDWSKSVSGAIFDMLFKYVKPYPKNHRNTAPSIFWSKNANRQTYASLGQVVYPGNKLNELYKALEAERIGLGSKMVRKCLKSQRELFGGFPGLRTVLQDANPDMEVSEDIRVRLRPLPKVNNKEQDGRIFPNLELRINADPITKTCHLSSARLIVDRREVDLLLPTEIADIRFCTETHIPSEAKIDPRILKFVESSNLDVFSRAALKTPLELSLTIPARSVRKAPTDASVVNNFAKSERSEDSKNSKDPKTSKNRKSSKKSKTPTNLVAPESFENTESINNPESPETSSETSPDLQNNDTSSNINDPNSPKNPKGVPPLTKPPTSEFEEGPDLAVTYTLSSVEHRSHMTGKSGNINLQYIILGGSIQGGHRDEIRVALRAGDEGRLNHEIFKTRFERLVPIIEKLRHVNHAEGTVREMAAPLASKLIRHDPVMGNIWRVES